MGTGWPWATGAVGDRPGGSTQPLSRPRVLLGAGAERRARGLGVMRTALPSGPGRESRI